MTILRQRMIEDMQVRNLSSSTRDTYLLQVSLFARHFRKSPTMLGPEELRSYQVYLINDKKLSPSSIQIAVAALRFLYKITLKKQWSFEEVLPAPKMPDRLPSVLSVRPRIVKVVLYTYYSPNEEANGGQEEPSLGTGD